MTLPNWENDAIQFPRLVEEAQAAGAFTDEVVSAMAVSMDLGPTQVNELLVRAQAAWDAIVAVTPDGPFPVVVAGDDRRLLEEGDPCGSCGRPLQFDSAEGMLYCTEDYSHG